MNKLMKRRVLVASVGLVGSGVVATTSAQAATQTLKVTRVKRTPYHATKG